MSKDIVILAIESSCDDTSAAVIKNGLLCSNVTASQKVHEEYGGVVPELASRAHQQNIVPVVDTALKRAGVTKEELSAIAFTRGPGLLGSLLVGMSFAKGYFIAFFGAKPQGRSIGSIVTSTGFPQNGQAPWWSLSKPNHPHWLQVRTVFR